MMVSPFLGARSMTRRNQAHRAMGLLALSSMILSSLQKIRRQKRDTEGGTCKSNL